MGPNNGREARSAIESAGTWASASNDGDERDITQISQNTIVTLNGTLSASEYDWHLIRPNPEWHLIRPEYDCNPEWHLIRLGTLSA